MLRQTGHRTWSSPATVATSVMLFKTRQKDRSLRDSERLIREEKTEGEARKKADVKDVKG
jgi:hypothetical protein|eukprot:COSAG06_NODE_5371_length_3518_cov_6.090130_4_plen_60_part_00